MNPFDGPSVSPTSDRSPSREVDMSAATGRAIVPDHSVGTVNRRLRSRLSLPLPIVLLVPAWFACAPGPDTGSVDAASADAASAAALADTLTQRIAEAYDFTRPDVVERMSALYPDTGRVISASGGYITTTADSLRQGLADFWANVGVNMSGPRWEWGDVHVDRLSSDAAVLTASWSIPHTAPTGRPHTISGAWTAVFRRMDGEWKIVQEHLSVPPAGQ